jgi:hypothetical protein
LSQQGCQEEGASAIDCTVDNNAAAMAFCNVKRIGQANAPSLFLALSGAVRPLKYLKNGLLFGAWNRITFVSKAGSNERNECFRLPLRYACRGGTTTLASTMS